MERTGELGLGAVAGLTAAGMAGGGKAAPPFGPAAAVAGGSSDFTPGLQRSGTVEPASETGRNACAQWRSIICADRLTFGKND